MPSTSKTKKHVIKIKQKLWPFLLRLDSVKTMTFFIKSAATQLSYKIQPNKEPWVLPISKFGHVITTIHHFQEKGPWLHKILYKNLIISQEFYLNILSRKFKFQFSISLRKIERNRSGIKLKHTELPYLGMDSTSAPNWFLSCFSISFASSVSLISIEGSSKRLAKSPVSGLRVESVVEFQQR